ncbi:hypothetical protein CLAIMM_01537 [Cladophialophora immunda]|nr:hypothetical protein CLAIMM_01537 [Cladophialophora immunda]
MALTRASWCQKRILLFKELEGKQRVHGRDDHVFRRLRACRLVIGLTCGKGTSFAVLLRIFDACAGWMHDGFPGQARAVRAHVISLSGEETLVVSDARTSLEIQGLQKVDLPCE